MTEKWQTDVARDGIMAERKFYMVFVNLEKAFEHLPEEMTSLNNSLKSV